MKIKLISFLLILFTLLSVLSSCRYNTPEGWQLAICAGHNVPGMFFGDFKYSNPEVNILEKDSKGRTLFEFTYNCRLTNTTETVLVICQKNDIQYTYCYEDICYTFELNDPTALETLKVQNDWDKELDESKMSRTLAQVSFDRAVIYESDHYNSTGWEEKLDRELNISEEQPRDLMFLDRDPEGNNLYCLNIFTDESQEHIEARYFVLCHPNGEFVYAKTDHEVFNKEDLIKLKKENGWKYGF